MKITEYCLLFVLGVLISGSAFAQTGFSIKGHVENAEGLKVYLTQRGGALSSGTETLLLDSVLVANGQFLLKGHVGEPQYYSIIIENKRGWKPFLLENKQYEITGDADAIWQAEIDGSEEILIRKKYVDLVNPLIKEMNAAVDSLQMMLQQGDTTKVGFYAEKNKYYSQEAKLTARDIILKYPDAYTSLFLFPELESVLNTQERQQIYEKFSNRIKQHSFAKKLHCELYELNDLITVGKEVIPFSLQDQVGDTVDLKGLRGKYVLIDFWASWCGPCRAKHPSLVELYKKYQSKDFEILGISIDKNPTHWKKALEEDKLPWKNVLDLKDSENKVASQYGIKAIPYNFLLDKNGVLIAKNLHDEKLINKLHELLEL